MDLKNFPMDVQTCIMQLESCKWSMNTHTQNTQTVCRSIFVRTFIEIMHSLAPYYTFTTINPNPKLSLNLVLTSKRYCTVKHVELNYMTVL